MDILTLLQSDTHHFSKGQRALSRYMQEHYEQAAFMTAASLGKQAGVSESTVVRFAVELGFDGYPAMQKAMQEAMVSRLAVAGMSGKQDACPDTLSLAIRADREALRKTEELLDRQAFAAAVEAIAKARKVYVIGFDAAAPVASYLGCWLEQLLDQAHTISASEPSAVLPRLARADHTDVLIGIHVASCTVAEDQIMDYCHSKGIKRIGITDSSVSSFGRKCEHVLLAKLAGNAKSLAVPMSVASALVMALASRPEGKARMEELERLRQQYSV